MSGAGDAWGEVPRPPLPMRLADLAGRSVFVTGGGSGIGAALTEGFMDQGANVAFVQRSDAGGFCDALEARHGTRPLALRADITDIPALRAALDTAAARHGPIEVLVNNAADDTRHDTLEVTEADWDRATAINLKAAFFACQAVLPAMQRAGRGAIVNISSVAYMMGMGGFPGYTASKAGLVSLSRTLAREWGPHGIRVNALAPGMVLTERQKRLWLTPEGVAAHVAAQCLRTPLVPEDIVGGVLFLASEASRMLTGQVMVVDGGLVAGG